MDYRNSVPVDEIDLPPIGSRFAALEILTWWDLRLRRLKTCRKKGLLSGSTAQQKENVGEWAEHKCRQSKSTLISKIAYTGLIEILLLLSWQNYDVFINSPKVPSIPSVLIESLIISETHSQVCTAHKILTDDNEIDV